MKTEKITREDIYNLAIIIVGNYYETHRPTITFTDTQEIFQYNEKTGLYEESENKIKNRIQHEWRELATISNVNECLNHIKRMTYTKREETNNPTLIPFQNGYYDLKKKCFEKYSPKVIFFSKHPIKYDPLALCPEIGKFLVSVTEGDTAKIRALKRIAAYCIYREYLIQKAIMLYGSGANGKSVYLNLLTYFLGMENVSKISLQELTSNRFAVGKLYGKNANIFADLESKALNSTGYFKGLTGGDYLTCDRKFRDAFDFKNYAKLLFSCNQIPDSEDQSDAFFRRWLIIPFTKVFKKEEQDPLLLAKLVSPSELSGFANVLLAEMDSLLKDYCFGLDGEDDIQGTRELYQRLSDSAKAFLMDCTELSPGEHERKSLIWQEYIKYCKQNRLPVKTEKAFHHSIQLFYEGQVWSGKKQELGERVVAWMGLKLGKIEEKESSTID